MKIKAREEKKLRQDFLAEAIELVEKPASPWGHVGIWVICSVVIIMGVWCVVGKIDVTVTARGKLLAGGDKGIQIVQTEKGGQIEKIFVKDGDRVEKGDVLISLVADSEKDMLDYKTNIYKENEYKEKLIRKLLAGKKLDASDEKKGEKYKAIYDYLLAIEEENEEKSKGVLLELESVREELSTTKRMLVYAKREAKDYNELYKGGAVAKKEWEDKRNVAEQQEMNVKSLRKKLEVLESSMKTLDNEYKTQLSSLLVENFQDSQQSEVEVNQSNNDYEAQFLRAPVSGIVKSVLVSTEGGILTAAQNAVEIIPDKEDYIMELTVLNRDIAYISKGQEVSIKLDAYDYQKYGKIQGKVIYISPDTFQDEQLGEVYVIQVEMLQGKEESSYSGIDWQGGIQGTAEVKVGERRIIDFFIEPVKEHFDGSLNKL